MMKILTLAFQIVAVLSGALAGMWLKNNSAVMPTDAAVDKTGVEGHVSTEQKDGKAGVNNHHGQSSDAAQSDYGYVKFSRQFVVPVIEADSVRSFVVLDLSLEVTSTMTESAYSREPKLRDALLNALMLLSSQGAFNNDFMSQSIISKVRASLLASAKTVLGEDAHDILILNIARQDL